MDDFEVSRAMNILAEIVEYEPKDISWLSQAMQCSVLKQSKKTKGRGAYTNGKMVALGEMVLRAVEANQPFTISEISDEDLTRKRDHKKYRKLFKLDMASGVHRYAYNQYGFYHKEPVIMHSPVPACDLYIEAIAAAVYLDRGFEYTKEWVKRFFNKYGQDPCVIYE